MKKLQYCTRSWGQEPTTYHQVATNLLRFRRPMEVWPGEYELILSSISHPKNTWSVAIDLLLECWPPLQRLRVWVKEMRECLVRSCNALRTFSSCHGAARLDVAHVISLEESASTIRGVNIQSDCFAVCTTLLALLHHLLYEHRRAWEGAILMWTM